MEKKSVNWVTESLSHSLTHSLTHTRAERRGLTESLSEGTLRDPVAHGPHLAVLMVEHRQRLLGGAHHEHWSSRSPEPHQRAVLVAPVLLGVQVNQPAGDKGQRPHQRQAGRTCRLQNEHQRPIIFDVP